MTQGMRLKDQPASERPRERLVAQGADALSPAELIAILLRTGLKGTNAVEIGRQLLQKYESLQALAQASVEDLQAVKGIGHAKAVTLVAAFTLARKMAAERGDESPVLDTPEAVANLMREDNRLRRVETFQVLLLNTRRRLIRAAEIADGTLDTLLVHPREVFEKAITAGAAAIVLVHNHPSGDPDAVRSRHQGDARFDSRRAIAEDRSAGPCHYRPRNPGAVQDYVSLRELGYFYT